ncbi:MAG: hypothetical protein JNK74_30455, partial [Candidatus Hydrogenedentes bacterium]|nr:hypothetical protein [Candidatus Hydrogenedentota bacterium]
DHLLADQPSDWRVATDAKTWRQRAQRAFAAELLAPIESIRQTLDGDFEADRIEQLARELDVSPFLVQSQLANNGLLDPGRVGATTV